MEKPRYVGTDKFAKGFTIFKRSVVAGILLLISRRLITAAYGNYYFFIPRPGLYKLSLYIDDASLMKQGIANAHGEMIVPVIYNFATYYNRLISVYRDNNLLGFYDAQE